MLDTDPNKLRLEAAKLLVGKLITSGSATAGQVPDKVAVVQFNDTSEVLYPLGDPSGAASKIDSVAAEGGTFIGSGVATAAEELTNGGTDTSGSGTTGILVLTDGMDDPVDLVSQTIEAINRAQQLGIRVSFGFLSNAAELQDPGIVASIIKSGGTFSTVKTAEDVPKLVAQALLNGLVGPPHTGSIPLLPGLQTAALLAQTSFNTFSYLAQPGEAFNITVTSVDPVSLKVTLKDAANGGEITSSVTDGSGVAFAKYTAPSKMNITIEVTSNTGPASGLFTVQLGSALDPCKPNTSQPPVVSSSSLPASPSPPTPSSSAPPPSSSDCPWTTGTGSAGGAVVTAAAGKLEVAHRLELVLLSLVAFALWDM
ncbi:hypothetical protein QBC34DRAFT_451686 [Podospora aff. communis PSN243]|uniref:VWFA domain-containing protein n=1 Tax=Podospora aff. communis PSN243 TaxID=3040156 RepID=A0AAV9G7M3_9PEZI|nr:hypothetical protein QBC34DRAFT_451686 [Podospora aff. communis PSN243]